MNSECIWERKYNEFHSCTKAASRVIGRRNFTHRLVIDILESLKLHGEKILDVGCGSGTIDYYLAQKGNFVTGIDISEKAIRACIESSKNLNINKYLKYERVRFPGKGQYLRSRYSAVMCLEVLEHMEDESGALERIRNVLEDRGLLILSVPSQNAPLLRYKFTVNFDKRVGHIRRYSCDTVKSLLETHGFRVLKIIKTEGILRNYLFLTPGGNKTIRYIRGILSDIVTGIDKLLVYIFGESNIIVLAER